MKMTPTGTINNCPDCDAYTAPGALPHLCVADTSDQQDIKAIREGLLAWREGSAAPEYEESLLNALARLEYHMEQRNSTWQLTEHLPKDGQRFLARLNKHQDIVILHWEQEDFQDDGDNYVPDNWITGWMPLPEWGR